MWPRYCFPLRNGLSRYSIGPSEHIRQCVRSHQIFSVVGLLSHCCRQSIQCLWLVERHYDQKYSHPKADKHWFLLATRFGSHQPCLLRDPRRSECAEHSVKGIRGLIDEGFGVESIGVEVFKCHESTIADRIKGIHNSGPMCGAVE